jgi:hypothetical protein
MLRRLKVRAMLDGVHEHLAKGHANRFPLLQREIRYLVNELNQTIRRLAVTTGDKIQPFDGECYPSRRLRTAHQET